MRKKGGQNLCMERQEEKNHGDNDIITTKFPSLKNSIVK